jgi:CRISPR-associated protein Cas2
MQWLICYDIADDRRRDRVVSWLKRFGHRVQESVFEVDAVTELDFQRLWSGLSNRTTIDDSLRAYPMPAHLLASVRVLHGETPKPAAYAEVF